MTDFEKASLVELLKDRSTKRPTDHILNVFKAGFATFPFTGGIASLMNDYIPNSKRARLEEFAERVAEDLSELQDQIDESLMLTDEFAYVFEKCFRGAAENYQAEKLDSFRGILVNSALGNASSESEKEYFLNLVNTLSALHIKILKFVARPDEYLVQNGIPQEEITGGFSNFFPIAIPSVNIEVIKSAFGELYQYGFINTDKTVFTLMTSGQGLELLGHGGRVTDFGHQFIDFCSSPCG